MTYNPYQVYKADGKGFDSVRVVTILPLDALLCRKVDGGEIVINRDFFEKYYYPVTSCAKCGNEYHNEDVADGDWIDRNQCLWICVNCCCCLSCGHICWTYETYSTCECPRTCPEISQGHSKPSDDSIRTQLDTLLASAQDLRIVQMQILRLVDGDNQLWESDADRAWREINQAHRALYMKLVANT